MFRSDFRFLEAMFPEASYKEYNILVINQTDTQQQLISNHPKVRVINTEERGLSHSRNMALDNAVGEICLIADDDVQYVSALEGIVVSAFAKAKNASVITFQMTRGQGQLYKKYPGILQHTEKTVQNVSSVEIALRRKEIKKLEMRFDKNFGLGATFPTAEEYIFLREVIEKGGGCLFESQVILSHPDVSSGQFAGKDAVIYGRAALRYKFMGTLAYLSMIKYVWFFYRRGEILFKEIPSKIATAFSGIKKYKNLNSQTGST